MYGISITMHENVCQGLLLMSIPLLQFLIKGETRR